MVRIFLRSSGESPSHPTRSNSASRATGEIAVHLDYTYLMVTDIYWWGYKEERDRKLEKQHLGMNENIMK